MVSAAISVCTLAYSLSLVRSSSLESSSAGADVIATYAVGQVTSPTALTLGPEDSFADQSACLLAHVV